MARVPTGKKLELLELIHAKKRIAASQIEKLRPDLRRSTIYNSMARMSKEGLLTWTSNERQGSPAERHYFELTELGHAMLAIAKEQQKSRPTGGLLKRLVASMSADKLAKNSP